MQLMLWLCAFLDDKTGGWKYFPEVQNLFSDRLSLNLRFPQFPSGGFFFFSWLALTSQIWWFKVELGIASWIPLATLPSVWSPQVTSWGSAELPPIRASLSAEKCDSAEPTHQPVGTFSNEPLNGKCTDNSGIKWAPLIDFPNQYGTGAPSLCHLLPLPGGILRPSIILIRHYTWHKCWVD